jgi:hypothetical protein
VLRRLRGPEPEVATDFAAVELVTDAVTGARTRALLKDVR